MRYMKKRNVWFIFCLALVLTAVPFLTACGGSSTPTPSTPAPTSPASQPPVSTMELKFGTFLPETDPSSQLLQNALSRVATLTEGRVSVKVYVAGTLAAAPDTPTAIQKGIMDMGYFPLAAFGGQNLPLLAIGALPFIYRDAVGYVDAWDKEDTLLNIVNQYLIDQGFDKVKIERPNYSGFYTLGFTNKEVKVPDDMQGLTLAARSGLVEVLKMYPCAVSYVDNPEVYDALTRGIVDGTPGLPTNWVNGKWMEPLNYRTKFNLQVVGSVVGYDPNVMAKLSATDQAVLQTCFDLIRAENNKRILLLDISSDATIAKNTKATYVPTPDQMSLWLAPRDEYTSKWVETVGPAGQQALDVVAKYNQQ